MLKKALLWDENRNQIEPWTEFLHLPLPYPKSSTPRPPQPLAQLFAQMRYRSKYQVSSTGPNILEVYIIYLHVYMCQYMKVLVKL